MLRSGSAVYGQLTVSASRYCTPPPPLHEHQHQLDSAASAASAAPRSARALSTCDVAWVNCIQTCMPPSHGACRTNRTAAACKLAATVGDDDINAGAGMQGTWWAHAGQGSAYALRDADVLHHTYAQQPWNCWDELKLFHCPEVRETILYLRVPE